MSRLRIIAFACHAKMLADLLIVPKMLAEVRRHMPRQWHADFLRGFYRGHEETDVQWLGKQIAAATDFETARLKLTSTGT